jgi:hypothetical protein
MPDLGGLVTSRSNKVSVNVDLGSRRGRPSHPAQAFINQTGRRCIINYVVHVSDCIAHIQLEHSNGFLKS